jgi:3-phytase
MNNIDLRYNFPFNGSKVVLVVVGNEGDGTLNFYTVNPSSRMLEARGSYKLNTSAPYGGCMYHSPVSGKYYYFVNWKSGVWQQVELTANGTTINGAVVRQHDAGGQTEGCVADDVHKYYYIGEEAVGVWRYGAEPGDGTSRLQINSSGEITPDTEGMSLYYRSDGGGYLIISSQGDSNLIVYERKPSSPTAKNAFIGKIQIGASGSIDAVSGTDGLDVTNFPLGSAFPKGMLVTHDQTNTGSSTSNHKYTPFERVAVALNLQMDTSWDPRLVGSGGSPQPTPTNTPGATTPTLTSGGVCPKKSSGDANCDQLVNMTDFEIFRKEYLQLISTRTSDFDSTGTVQMGDFEIWRRTIFAI